MNKGIAVTKLVEEAKYLENETIKNFSGSITDPDKFEQNLPALENLHSGLFAFLAFHPGIDRAVGEYIEKGSLASDSGANILVFFLSTVEMRLPRNIKPEHLDIGVTLELNIHPAYEFARWLFSNGVMPKLPGLVFFDHVCRVVQAVYVPIPKSDTVDDVARFCRSVFTVGDNVVKERLGGEGISIDLFCRKLKSNGVEYSRNGSTSIGEWVVTLFNFAKKNGGTIASVILKVIKLG